MGIDARRDKYDNIREENMEKTRSKVQVYLELITETRR